MGGDANRPGRPDRMQRAPVLGDGWDFLPNADHNAGACVRGACVIRVNPLPAGFEEIDWKNFPSLRRFVSERGKIRSRRITGTCRRHQVQVGSAIKRAREMALLPYVAR